MTPDARLEELFVRYWDNTLTDAEGEELERRLATDPAAREWFRTLGLQAVTVAELSSVRELAGVEPARGRWSRRRVLRLAGGGLAASVAGVLGWRAWGDSTPTARFGAVRGEVQVSTGRGTKSARAGAVVPAGARISTLGLNSSAALTCPDGTAVTLSGDSVLVVAEGALKLKLLRGYATADLRPSSGSAPLELATTDATVTTPHGALLTLGHVVHSTEVVVEDGAVEVFDPADARLAVVGAGEMFRVHSDGTRQKQPTPITPDEFDLDLARPLPDDWEVGQRQETADGPVVVPEWWYDPYHSTEMWQIRSDKRWSRGFVKLVPDSVLEVKYWVERPGPGQVLACVRAARLPKAETGVVACNGAFENAAPRRWNVLRVKAADMLDNVHAPTFGPPWVGFLLIVNTYKTDLA